MHGGLASGISQALWEQFVYDDDGNPLTSTLADYALPSAAEFPSFEAAHTETPSPLNPLGAKGIGESATVGSTPAVQNAVVDALSHLGVRHVDMPCTPEQVWQAIRGRRAGSRPTRGASRRPPSTTSSAPPAPPPPEEDITTSYSPPRPRTGVKEARYTDALTQVGGVLEGELSRGG